MLSKFEKLANVLYGYSKACVVAGCVIFCVLGLFELAGYETTRLLINFVVCLNRPEFTGDSIS